jgi:hypothetical protein
MILERRRPAKLIHPELTWNQRLSTATGDHPVARATTGIPAEPGLPRIAFFITRRWFVGFLIPPSLSSAITALTMRIGVE